MPVVRSKDVRKITPLLQFLCVLLVSFTPVHSASDTTVVEPLHSAFEMKKIYLEYGDCDSFTTPCAWVKFEYPVFQSGLNKAILDSITLDILLALNNYGYRENTISNPDSLEQPEAVAKDYLDAEAVGFTDYPPLRGTNGYEHFQLNEISVEFETDSIITLRYKEGIANGGIHRYFTSYVVYHKRSGAKLDLPDILRAGYEDTLLAVGEAIFRKEQNLSSSKSFEKAGFHFAGDRFTLPANFGVIKDSIVFWEDYFPIGQKLYSFIVVVPLSALGVYVRDDW